MDNVFTAYNDQNLTNMADFPYDPSFFHAFLGQDVIFGAGLSTVGSTDPNLSNAAFAPSNVSFVHTTENSLSQALNDTAIYPNSKLCQTDSCGINTRLETEPELENAESLTMSTAFQDIPEDPNRPAPDTIFISSDAVVFYVDEESLLKTSSNSFDGLLPIVTQSRSERVRHLSDVHSSKLNVILHILYNTSCSHYNPSLHVIISAIDRLPTYGIAPRAWVTKSHHIYDLLIPYVPLYPLEIYCLCGRYDIYELATVVSSHLLSLKLDSLTEEDAEKMGSVYFARLFRLHRSRVDALLKSLMLPPALHDPTPRCGFDDQKTLTSAWAMAIAYLSWSAKPDTPTSAIRRILDSMTQHITCKKCLKGRDERVNKIIMNWTLTKNTI